MLKFCTLSVRGCWGQPMILFWKLIDETQISKPPEPTRHHNSIKLWILLPLRADLLCTLQCEIPCTKVRSLSLSILLFVFFDWYLCILLLLALYHDNTFAVHSPKHLYPSYYLLGAVGRSENLFGASSNRRPFNETGFPFISPRIWGGKHLAPLPPCPDGPVND